MRVSHRFRRMLAARYERLIEAGFNALPKWIDSKSPALRKGEQYQRYLIEPMKPDDEFVKEMKKRILEDPRIGGIAIICGIAGLIGIDYDVPKVADVESRIFTVAKEYGHMVYFDRRYGMKMDTKALVKGGFHGLLSIDQDRLQKYRIKVEHNFNAEFTIKTYGLISIFPSGYVDKKEKIFSVYLKLSSCDIFETLYDENLDTLPRIIEALGGKLKIEPIQRLHSINASDRNAGQPWHDISDGALLDDTNVWLFLRNVAKLIGCDGLYRLIETIERREPIPLPYRIYADIIADCNHPRSTWTIAENIIFRILGEIRASEKAYQEVLGAFKESEEKYEKIYGATGHDTLAVNAKRAYIYKEFGHDMAGACIFKVAGLCLQPCDLTCWMKIKSSLGRDALIEAIKLARMGREVEINA